MPGALVCGIEALDEDVRALAVARGLSERLGLGLVAVHVVENGAEPREAAAGRRLAEQAAEAYVSHPSASRIEFGDPVRSLVTVVDEESAEMLVVGSRGMGPLRGALLGSVSMGVMASAPCPVVVVSRAAALQGPRRGVEHEPGHSIVCGVDGSEDSLAGASLASDLATRLELRLVLAHVTQAGDDGSSALHRAAATVSHRCAAEVRLEQGDPAARLDALAEQESAELIVVGSRGAGRVRSALVGSVAARLAATGRVPVVVLSPHVRLAAGSGEYELEEVVP